MKHLPTTAALCLALLPAACALAQDGSALDRLPEETVGAVVLPDAGKWTEDLSKTTRLGQILNDPKRWSPVWDAIEKGDDQGKLAKFRNEMARLHLTNDDLKAIFRHDFGMAVLLLKNPANKGKPLPLLVVWSGCGQPLADKLKAAILDPKVQEQDDKDAGQKTVRTDLNANLTRLRKGAFDAKGENGGDDDTHEEIVKHPKHGLHPEYTYIGAAGGHLIVAGLLGDPKDEAELAAFEKVATPAVAQFVAAQTRPGAGAFSKRLMKSPAVRDAMSKRSAAPLAQILVDVPAIVTLAKADYLGEHPDKAAEADKLIKGLGLDGAGPLAFTLGSTPSRLTSSMAWDCPAPRRGLFRLLDQKNSVPAVPDWVGAEAVQYAQYNFDLGAAMDIVVESIKAAVPTEEDAMQVDNGLAMANGSIAAQLGGLKLRDLLAGFGATHRMVAYPADPAARPPAVGLSVSLANFANANAAFVWQDANPEVWRKVMDAIGRFMNKPDSPFFRANEQDYSGWATKPGGQVPIETGLFIGKNGLVWGLGKDSARKAITGLNTPGKHNHLLEDCRAVMPLRDAWIQAYGDARPQIKNSLHSMETLIEAGEKRRINDDPAKQEKAKAIRDAFLRAMPTPAEVDESFGMTAQQGWTDAAGFHGESAMVLQPAKK